MPTANPGLIIGQRGGKPLVHPMLGSCSPLATDDIFIGVQSGGKNVKPLVAWNQSICDGSALPQDVPLLGVQVGGKDGKPLVLGFCKTCDGAAIYCDCTICCTLTGTIQLPSIADSAVWSDPIDIELTCGESFSVWNGEYYCLNDEVEDDNILIDAGITTYSGRTGTTTVSDPPYGTSSADFVTDVWKSQEITYNSTTYRVVFVATQYTLTEGSLRVYCAYAIIIQVLTASGWCTFVVGQGSPAGYAFGSPDADVITTVVTGAPETECPAGYHYNGGEGFCAAGYSANFDTQDEESVPYCPISYSLEAISAPSTKRAKVILADLC